MDSASKVREGGGMRIIEVMIIAVIILILAEFAFPGFFSCGVRESETEITPVHGVEF